jgi:hypothetical protein
MAQKIIIPAHKVKLIDLKGSIKNGKFNKLFFQCALKEIRNNGSDREAVFSIIAYAGKRNIFQHWNIGSKVDCEIDNSIPPKEFNLAEYPEPIGFGNNEVHDFDFTIKQKESKKADVKKVKQDNLMDKIKKLLKDPEKSKTAFLTLKAKISSNPHVTYDISIDGTAASANPSPPADPS